MIRGGTVQYMVIEKFKNGPEPVYRRFREKGRMAPAGLTYMSSWVDKDLTRCFQLMETADPALLEQWAAHWSDIVSLEVVPVISSAEAAATVVPTGSAPSV
jgi:Protein of unknown function (DUF3303)